MAKASTKAGIAAAEAGTEGGATDIERLAEAPRSVAIAAAGVTTGSEFAGLMSALMSDVIEGRISPVVSNAAVNAGGKLLKVVEMEYRYGRQESVPEQRKPSLALVPGSVV